MVIRTPYFKTTAERVLGLLLLYSLTRLLYYGYNHTHYLTSSSGEVAFAFLHGIRFDIAAIFIVNSPFFLIGMLPARWTSRRFTFQILRALFVIVNGVFITANVADSDFVNFIGKRLSYEYVFLSQDVVGQKWPLLINYWFFALASLVLTLIAGIFYRRQEEPAPGSKWYVELAQRILVAGLVVLGIRGGFQLKPLHPMHAYPAGQHELGLLTLNTPFNFFRTRANGKVTAPKFFATDKEAIERLVKMTSLTRPPLGNLKNFNVMVLVIESFATEFVGVANDYPGYTPFFDSLTKRENAFYYKYNFANGRRSIEGIPAVMCGLPSMMEEAILISEFSNDRMDCLPTILGQHGYDSYFLHGAHNGSMHFDTFSNVAGFKHFVGLNEFPVHSPDDVDKAWGVLDEPMFQYAAEVMTNAKKPAMVGVFSLSSHFPYYVPPHLRGKFPKGTEEIHESIGYTDYSLQKFFETAEKQPWFNNTIFVLTADHTSKTSMPKYVNILGYSRVPLLIYIPGLKGTLKPEPNRITQHVDIQPTILDLLGIQNRDRLLLGQSIFDEGNPGRAYNYTSVNYWYMDGQDYIEYYYGSKEVRVYKHTNTYDIVQQQRAPTPEENEKVQNLLAVPHYFNRGLIYNDLFKWREKL